MPKTGFIAALAGYKDATHTNQQVAFVWAVKEKFIDVDGRVVREIS